MSNRSLFKLLPSAAAIIFTAGCATTPPAEETPAETASSVLEDIDTKPFPPIAFPRPAPALTRILDQTEAQRLIENSGITLQWIDWDQRGNLTAEMRDGALKLKGRQAEPDGQNGRLALDGSVVEIGTNYFIFSGIIRIENAPDKGRDCVLAKPDLRFEVTQGRKYWRLREFEWCDGLTDYVDIYF